MYCIRPNGIVARTLGSNASLAICPQSDLVLRQSSGINLPRSWIYTIAEREEGLEGVESGSERRNALKSVGRGE